MEQLTTNEMRVQDPLMSSITEVPAGGQVIKGLRTDETVDAFTVKCSTTVPKENLNVTVKGSILTIQADRGIEQVHQDETTFVSQSSYGKEVRSVPLPENTKVEGVKTRFTDGNLEIHFPKTNALPVN